MTRPPGTPVRSRGWPGARLSGIALLVIAGSTAAAAVAVHRITGRFWGDLAAIRASASVAAARDGAVYQVVFHRGEAHEFAYPYPPFATLLFQPLARIGMPVAVGAWTLLSVLALAAGVWVALRAAGLAADQRPAVTLVVTLASLPMFAVSGHLQVGQVGLFLMLLVLFDLTAKPHRWWHGLGVGIAAGIKLTPLIFVVYLLVTGRIRAAATATAGFLATVVVGLAWRPADSVWYWGGGFLDPSRVAGDPRTILNQSLRGALARLVDSGDPRLLWLPVAALTGVAGLAVAAWCARAGDHLGGVVAGATTGLLVSPVSWHHHWVWCVPALVLLAGRAWRARSRAGLVAAGGLWLVFVAGTAWVTAGLQGRDLHFRGWGLVYSNLWVLAGLAGLGYLAVRGVRLYASRRRVR